jgi:hypothetical protein
MPFAPFPLVLTCAGASISALGTPSSGAESVAPLTVTDRVRAIELVNPEAPVVVELLARTAEDAAVAVDWGSEAILEATLCPPTVGNHPLVSGVLDLADTSSVVDRCAVGEVCRGDAGAPYPLDAGEVGDG